jgi:hypothetical protein
MASLDPERAAELLREGMDGLDALKGTDDSANIRGFQRLIRDLTGGMVGGEPLWLMKRLADVTVHGAGSFAQETLSRLLVRAWARTLELGEHTRVLQSAAGDYLKRLSTLPLGCEVPFKTVLGRVMADLDQRRGALDVDGLLVNAASDLALQGHGDRAWEAAQGVTNVERRDAVAREVELLCYFYGLGDKAQTEQTLFDVIENKVLAAATVQLLRESTDIDAEIDSMLAVLLNLFLERRVRYITFELGPTLAAIVIHRGARKQARLSLMLSPNSIVG